MAGIKDIIATQEKAAANFDKAVETSEKKIFDEVVLLIKDLETTPKGNIKTSISNLKRVQKIRTQLSKIANNKEYLKAVADLVGSFDKIYQQQLAFYAKKNQSTRSAEKKKLVQTIARENTIESLSGAGLATNVLDQIDNMLVKAVTTGVKFTDLQDQLHAYLVTDSKSQGALAKYAKTYAVTALSQYAGQNNKLFTEDLGTEWFEYVGSEIETTRPLCNALIKKRYIHKSEIPTILKGHIHIEGGEDIDVDIYPKTKLPYGMIEGTNPDNFQVNVGGWNCRHQLIPVADAAVPENIRAPFDKKAQEEIAKKKAEEEKKAKVAELKDTLEKYSDWNGYDKAAIDTAIKTGDIQALESQVVNMHTIEEQLKALTLISSPKEAIKHFSLQDLEEVQKAISKKLNWLDSNGYKGEKLLSKLTDEITKYLPNLKKHATWQLAEEAYKKKILEVQKEIALESLKSDYAKLQNFSTTSKIFKKGLVDLDDAITNGDINKAQALVSQLQAKEASLTSRRALQKQNKPVQQTSFDDEDAFSQDRKDKAVWSKTKGESTLKKHYKISNIKEVWKAASKEEKHAAWNYTKGSAYMTETLRGLKCKFYRYKHSWGRGIDDADLIKREIDSLTDLINKSYNSEDIWVKRDDLWAFCMYRWNLSLTPKICDWYRKRNRLDSKQYPDEKIAELYEKYTTRMGENSYYKLMREYYAEHPEDLVGSIGIDESFVSCGNNKQAHFKDDPMGAVELFIYCPKGTKMINAVSFNNYEHGGDHCGTENWDGETEITSQRECEYILQRGSKLRIIKAYTAGSKLCIDCEVVGQAPLPFALNGDLYDDGVYATF